MKFDQFLAKLFSKKVLSLIITAVFACMMLSSCKSSIWEFCQKLGSSSCAQSCHAECEYLIDCTCDKAGMCLEDCLSICSENFEGSFGDPERTSQLTCSEEDAGWCLDCGCLSVETTQNLWDYLFGSLRAFIEGCVSDSFNYCVDCITCKGDVQESPSWENP